MYLRILQSASKQIHKYIHRIERKLISPINIGLSNSLMETYSPKKLIIFYIRKNAVHYFIKFDQFAQSANMYCNSGTRTRHSTNLFVGIYLQ